MLGIVKLVTNVGQFDREVCKSTFKDYIDFSKSWGMAHHHKTHFKADRPVYLGSTILELSKLRMFEFYYKTFKLLWEGKGANCSLLYTDTDSYICNVTYPLGVQGDSYKDMQDIREELDTSGYSPTHPFFTTTYCEMEKKDLF